MLSTLVADVFFDGLDVQDHFLVPGFVAGEDSSKRRRSELLFLHVADGERFDLEVVPFLGRGVAELLLHDDVLLRFASRRGVIEKEDIPILEALALRPLVLSDHVRKSFDFGYFLDRILPLVNVHEAP